MWRHQQRCGYDSVNLTTDVAAHKNVQVTFQSHIPFESTLVRISNNVDAFSNSSSIIVYDYPEDYPTFYLQSTSLFLLYHESRN